MPRSALVVLEAVGVGLACLYPTILSGIVKNYFAGLRIAPDDLHLLKDREQVIRYVKPAALQGGAVRAVQRIQKLVAVPFHRFHPALHPGGFPVRLFAGYTIAQVKCELQ